LTVFGPQRPRNSVCKFEEASDGAPRHPIGHLCWTLIAGKWHRRHEMFALQARDGGRATAHVEKRALFAISARLTW
jgi:hypothetical protein